MERPLGFVPDGDTFSFHNRGNDDSLDKRDSHTNLAPELLFGSDCAFGRAGVCYKFCVIGCLGT